jgi:hypothetical protein
MNPLSIFQARQAQFQAEIDRIQKSLDMIAFVRLGVFLMAVGVQIASWGWGGAWWLLMLMGGLVGFGMTVRWNEKVKTQLLFQQTLLRINTEEIMRLEGKLGSFDEGETFIDPLHPYGSDLDIFGKFSLYQLCSRATTRFGKRRIAQWLMAAADVSAISERQASAALLAPQIDWRQMFQAIGSVQQAQEDVDAPEGMRGWLRERGMIAARPLLGILPWIMMSLLAIEIGLEVAGVIGTGYFAIILFANFVINFSIGKQVERVRAASEQRGQLLKTWAKLISQIEGLKDGGSAVALLQQRLLTQGRPASAEIARLGGIVANLAFRDSGLPYFVINTIFFWDIFCLKALEKWKADLGERVMDWFEVIGEMEALSSLAAIRFAFPDWSNPEIVEGAFLLEATDMGHPLIPPQQRIDNPMHITGNGTIWLVTGSNMSGKSTYLRTAGTNVVLALMGAPVCATSMRLSPMQVATSMRTTDNLEENTSSFYAELKRLKSVIELVRNNKNTFFLLDEILKGTNSRDRQAGARALVQQLHKLGGAGLVSTHDIEIVDMAAQMPLAIHNYSFNCTVTPEGQLLFDYKLTDGQCLSMNATALMRAMGIEV